MKEATAKIIPIQSQDGFDLRVLEALKEICTPPRQAKPGDILGHARRFKKNSDGYLHHRKAICKEEYAIMKTDRGIEWKTMVDMMRDENIDRKSLRILGDVTAWRRTQEEGVEKSMKHHALRDFCSSRKTQPRNDGTLAIYTAHGALSLRFGFGGPEDNMFRGAPAIQCNQPGINYLISAFITPAQSAHERIEKLPDVRELDALWRLHLETVAPNRKSLKLVPVDIE
jgi:hypothetical protein